MRILLVNTGIIPVPPPKGGAIENHTYNLAREFSKLGHKVDYVTDITRDFDIKGVNVYPVKTSQTSFQQSYFKMGIRNIRASIRTSTITSDLIDENDVVHMHEKLATRIFCKLNKQRIPLVFTFHNPLPSVFKYKDPIIQNIREISTQILDIPSVKCSSKTIVVSSALKKELVKRYNISNRKIEFVPNGVDTDYFTPDKKNEDLEIDLPEEFILYVGRLDYRKGVHNLILSMKDIPIPLVVVGGGPEKNNLIALANRLNIRNKIIFLDAVNRSELPIIYARATIFTLPSLGEGLPLVILEAMASGLPIVATDISGIRDAVEDNGKIVPPGNIKKLNKAIKTILNEDIPKLRLKSRKIAEEKFSWTQVARRLVKIYESI